VLRLTGLAASAVVISVVALIVNDLRRLRVLAFFAKLFA
jgi:hypothetical protein